MLRSPETKGLMSQIRAVLSIEFDSRNLLHLNMAARDTRQQHISGYNIQVVTACGSVTQDAAGPIKRGTHPSGLRARPVMLSVWPLYVSTMSCFLMSYTCPGTHRSAKCQKPVTAS